VQPGLDDVDMPGRKAFMQENMRCTLVTASVDKPSASSTANMILEMPGNLEKKTGKEKSPCMRGLELVPAP
jgi:hypothetical protein